LTARDVLALDLRGPRLVVLTACRAAVAGAEGEGTWTLAHAFLAAGVTTVVANLWEVDDRAGERLAVAFHRHLTAGAAPAAALRAAQLEMLASPDPRDRDPAAWAGFRVVGAGG
jgi:CHAT domain-containing protein